MTFLLFFFLTNQIIDTLNREMVPSREFGCYSQKNDHATLEEISRINLDFVDHNYVSITTDHGVVWIKK